MKLKKIDEFWNSVKLAIKCRISTFLSTFHDFCYLTGTSTHACAWKISKINKGSQHEIENRCKATKGNSTIAEKRRNTYAILLQILSHNFKFFKTNICFFFNQVTSESRPRWRIGVELETGRTSGIFLAIHPWHNSIKF